MHQLCLYVLVVTFSFAISDGQDGSSNKQIMIGKGSMSYTSPDGTVHSMASNESGSFMTTTNSKGKVQGMDWNPFGSFMTNMNFNRSIPIVETNDSDSHSFSMSEGDPIDSLSDRIDGFFKGLDIPRINILDILSKKPTNNSDRAHIKFMNGTLFKFPKLFEPKDNQTGGTSFHREFFTNSSSFQSSPNGVSSSGNTVVVSGGNGQNGADASEGGADGADGSIQVQASGNGPPIVHEQIG